MKSLILGAAMLAAAIPAFAQTNVSITVGQPGFYGRIDIGDWAPAPVVVHERPVIIERTPRYEPRAVYLRVPPGHRKNWAKHCDRYRACGHQVYFVTDEWYERSYAPRYREQYHAVRHEERSHGHGRGQDKHHDKHHDKHRDKHHGKHHD